MKAKRVKPGMSVGEAARAVLRRHFGRAQKHEPGARLGRDIEELHRLRVAIRRCRSAHRLFRDHVPALPAELPGELRWIMGHLGPVRDLDVHLLFLREGGAGAFLAEGDDLAPLVERLGARRTSARERLIAALDSERWRRLVEETNAWLKSDPPLGGAAIESVAGGMTRRFLRRVHKAADRVEPDVPSEIIHRLRIRAKELRYCLEFLGKLWGKPAETLLARLRESQDVLGEFNDCEVSAELWRNLVEEESERLDSAALSLLRRIRAGRIARAHELRRRLDPILAIPGGKDWSRLEEVLRRASS